MDPSPGPWTLSEHMYGIAHCLIDRDGRVIGCNLPIGNGPLLEQAPAMVQILRELVAGAPTEHYAGALRRYSSGSIPDEIESRARMTITAALRPLPSVTCGATADSRSVAKRAALKRRFTCAAPH
jgi:hypothetical protein